MPCDYTYCGEACAKYYHCQFEDQRTAECMNAPSDCGTRCAGCPPPHSPPHHGSHYGSHYGYGSHNTNGTMPCDYTYCGEACAKYYHCQFEDQRTAECMNAPSDCGTRCAGCPPPHSPPHH